MIKNYPHFPALVWKAGSGESIRDVPPRHIARRADLLRTLYRITIYYLSRTRWLLYSLPSQAVIFEATFLPRRGFLNY